MNVVIERPRDNGLGSSPASIPFLTPAAYIELSKYCSLTSDCGDGGTSSRPRSSSDCAEVRCPPRVARSGIPHAVPPAVRRSRTVHPKIFVDKQTELIVAKSAEAEEHGDHVPSLASTQQHSVLAKVLSPHLSLPETSIKPHQQGDTAPWRCTQPRSLPTLIAAKGFLQCFWRIPSGIYYYKRTPFALENYTQKTFELLVTAGYILEDAKGFLWFDSGEYELFKCREDARINATENSDRASSVYSHSKHPHPVTASVKPGQRWQQATVNAGLSLHERRPPTRKLSVLRVCTTRYPWTEDEPDYSYVALFPRWTFPKGVYYRQDVLWFPGMTKTDIEDAVTAGYLIEDDIGLLIAHTDQYKLLRVHNIAEHRTTDPVANQSPPKVKCPTCEKKKRENKDVPHLEGREVLCNTPLLNPQIIQPSSPHPSPPSTPIVEEDNLMTERPKLERKATSLLDLGLGLIGPRTRFNASSTSLDSMGVVSEEKVEDDQEKWGRMRKEHAEKMKREKEENLMVKATMARLNGIAWTHPFAAKE